MFVVPVTKAAHEVAEAMRACDGDVAISLSRPGDTLFIDNWNCLHGRGPVGEAAMSRELERAYLARINI